MFSYLYTGCLKSVASYLKILIEILINISPKSVYIKNPNKYVLISISPKMYDFRDNHKFSLRFVLVFNKSCYMFRTKYLPARFKLLNFKENLCNAFDDPISKTSASCCYLHRPLVYFMYIRV